MTLLVVTLAICAIPVAGMEENILTTAADDPAIDPGAGDEHSRWNTKVLTANVERAYMLPTGTGSSSNPNGPPGN